MAAGDEGTVRVVAAVGEGFADDGGAGGAGGGGHFGFIAADDGKRFIDRANCVDHDFGKRSVLVCIVVERAVRFYVMQLAGDVAQRRDLFDERGAQGFCYNGGRLASAAAPFAIGAASKTHNFAVVITCAALFFAIGAVLVWLLPETKGTEL